MNKHPHHLPFRSVDWKPAQPSSVFPGTVRLLDQTLLPTRELYLETSDLEEIFVAIRTLKVRGAPAIGVAAAMGAAAHVQHAGNSIPEVIQALNHACVYLATSRPTAVNLFWALERMKRFPSSCKASSADDLKKRLIEEAIVIRDEDAAMCRAIGEHGATLLKDGDKVLTHCNAGALATSEWGTALAPIYVAAEQGKRVHVFADETRPLLQGARLTAWELTLSGVQTTLICDNTAAYAMKTQGIAMVFVGADRIAANGDAANKVGTYGVALLAKAHQIPFYVLAPSSTFDIKLAHGDEIPIEMRSPLEVTEGFGKKTAPDNIQVLTPAFDVTPASLISGIICEKGILRPPFGQAIQAFMSRR